MLCVLIWHTGKVGLGFGMSTNETLGPQIQDPKMFRWDAGPGTLDLKILKWDLRPSHPMLESRPSTPIYFSRIQDFQFSIVLIVYSTLILHFHYTSLVTKLYINLFIRLTYFMTNIQKQPLRYGANFKEL